MLGQRRDRLGEEQPPAAPGEDDPQHLMVRTGSGLGHAAGRRPPDRLHVKGEPDVGRRALEPAQVILEGKQPSVIDPGGIEYAVPAEEAVVGGRDRAPPRRA